jgi:Brp/Blh family beta-carotene 15,15'-monooxygenase
MTAMTALTGGETARPVPGTDLDPSVRTALVRGVLVPGWLVTAALIVPFALGVSIPPALQFVPLVASAVLLGLPHGAVDHFAYPRVNGDPISLRAIGVVVAVYLVLGGLYGAVWFLAPLLAFLVFIALTWAHWGQGDLYALLAFADADYLRTRTQRALTTVVRGGLPMLVPLLAFPEVYRRVARAFVGLFGSASVADIAWLFAADTRLALAAGYGTVVALTLALGVARTDPASRSSWAIDAGETLLLIAYFAVVPPILAVGVYFCVWHAYRHIARLVLLEADSRTALGDRDLWPALARFGREAAPLTAVSLVLLVALYLVVPRQPGDLLALVALYLVLIAVLTLPHVAVVSWMDHRQAVWRPSVSGLETGRD